MRGVWNDEESARVALALSACANNDAKESDVVNAMQDAGLETEQAECIGAQMDAEFGEDQGLFNDVASAVDTDDFPDGDRADYPDGTGPVIEAILAECINGETPATDVDEDEGAEADADADADAETDADAEADTSTTTGTLILIGASAWSGRELVAVVCAVFTNNARRPVSGWVRTAGCSATYSVRASSRPPERMRSSRVFVTSALAEELTPTRPSSWPSWPAMRSATRWSSPGIPLAAAWRPPHRWPQAMRP